MTPLLVGALLAVIGLVIVLYPLFDDRSRLNRGARRSKPEGAAASVEVLRRIPMLLTLGARWSGKAHALGPRLPRGA